MPYTGKHIRTINLLYHSQIIRNRSMYEKRTVLYTLTLISPYSESRFYTDRNFIKLMMELIPSVYHTFKHARYRIVIMIKTTIEIVYDQLFIEFIGVVLIRIDIHAYLHAHLSNNIFCTFSDTIII